jgi:hypothetical protein
MEELSVKTVTRDGNCLFQWFCPFVAFEIIQNKVQLHINIKKDYKCIREKLGAKTLHTLSHTHLMDHSLHVFEKADIPRLDLLRGTILFLKIPPMQFDLG